MLQVIGHRGMLGSAVIRYALRKGIALSSHDCNLDVVAPSHIQGTVVINCAGIVKQNHVSIANMMQANAVGPHRLAAACSHRGAKLIHVSTDCVFERPGPHSERDVPDALGDYARSKLAGEVGNPHLTLRTSFVGFGQRGLLHEMQTQPGIEASHRLLWSGHTVDTIAQLLVDLSQRSDPWSISGLLHVPGEFQTRLLLVRRLKERWGLDTDIYENDRFVADRRLVSDWWEKFELPKLPPFMEQLEVMEQPQ